MNNKDVQLEFLISNWPAKSADGTSSSICSCRLLVKLCESNFESELAFEKYIERLRSRLRSKFSFHTTYSTVALPLNYRHFNSLVYKLHYRVIKGEINIELIS